jgi:hypothetical protein
MGRTRAQRTKRPNGTPLGNYPALEPSLKVRRERPNPMSAAS